jgi:NAD+ diphosphatase
MNTLEMTGWKRCPRCGEHEISHRGDAALECSACAYLYYHSPAAAVVGIVQYQDKIIITRRANDPGKGLLAIPGGFVEHGETLEQTLVRELHEELNIHVADSVYLASFASEYLFRDVLYKTAVAYFVVRADITHARAADDIDHFELVTPDKVNGSKLAFDIDRQALARYGDWCDRCG